MTIRMISCLIIAAGIFLGPSQVNGQSGDRVNISIVAHGFSSGQLTGYAELPSNRIIDLGDLNSHIAMLLERLRREGYPLAQIDSVIQEHSFKRSSITVYVNPGVLMTVGRMEISGLDSTFEIESMKSGSRLTETGVLSISTEVLDLLTDTGFLMSQMKITPSRSELKDGLIMQDLKVDVQRGQYLRLGEVQFPGIRTTRPRTLMIASRLKRGDTVRRSDINSAIKRIGRLSYIERVGEPEVVISSIGIAMLKIPVVEQRSGRISGALTGSAGEATTGHLELALGNLFGSGREAGFLWSKPAPERGITKAHYREPYIGGMPITAILGLNIRSEDTLGSATNYLIGCDVELRDGLYISGRGEDQRFSKEQHRRTIWGEGELRINRFDFTDNPSRGYRLSIKTAVGSRKSDTGRSTDQIRREEATVETALKLRNRWIGYLRAGQTDIAGRSVMLFDIPRVGGTKTVRGYAEESYPVRGALFGTIELRLRQEMDAGYLGIFTDAGSLYRLDSGYLPDRRELWAYGLTVAFQSRAGQMKIDLAFPYKERFDKGRIHVLLSTWF